MSVLVVDDDASFLDVAADLLRSRGFDVVGRAHNDAEALSEARRLHPDAVLLDVHLGESDALALAAQLTQLEGAPRVLLTSSDPGVTAELARKHGAVGYIAKVDLVAADLVRCFAGA